MSLRGGRSVVARLFLRRLSICGETAHIRVKNSLSSGSNIISKPSSDKPLTWYSCGPTVYDNAHLGHARTYICTDIIRRILNDYFKLDVIFAMGVTDIDDKIVKRAEETGQNWKALAQKYESAFLSDMKNLNVREPDALLRVTEHVEDIIEYVRKIHQSGKAYESEDGVYFSVSDLGSRYGKLGRSLADEVATDDLDSAKVKRDPRDFALWKKTNTLPNWDSPWGKGRPGWHIECSAMTNSYFGPDVDIHSGGIDLAFPHHTNEIVQW